MLPRMLLVLLFVFGAMGDAANAQTIQVNRANRTIAVTMSANAGEEADVATLHLGYVAYGPTSRAAYAKASELSNAIVARLEKAGIAKDHIQSQRQSTAENLNDNLNLPEEQRALRAYRVHQSWSVRLRASDAAKVLNLAVEAGANDSGQIEWSIADNDALEARASLKALARDKQMASRIARNLGTTLGPLLYVSNQSPAADRGVPFLTGVMGGGSGLATAQVVPLSIEPQRITDSATVYAVFAIR